MLSIEESAGYQRIFEKGMEKGSIWPELKSRMFMSCSRLLISLTSTT